MTDSVTFRKAQSESPTPDTLPTGPKHETTGQSDGVEVPFTEYHRSHGKPYVVDHYELGETWDDPQGGFESEITVIEDYLKQRIELGELADSKEAVAKEIREMERINNIRKEERTVIKLGTLSAYAKFLLEKDRIKTNVRKYGTNH